MDIWGMFVDKLLIIVNFFGNIFWFVVFDISMVLVILVGKEFIVVWVVGFIVNGWDDLGLGM